MWGIEIGASQGASIRGYRVRGLGVMSPILPQWGFGN